MDAIRTRLTQSSSVGVAEDDEAGGAQRVEMRFVTSDEEAGPSTDITALVQRYRHGYRGAGVFLCLCGVVVFATAFLLAYAVFGGRYHCSQVGEEDEEQGGGAKPPAEGGAGLYLGELRVMMRRLLQDEDIHNTVSRVSRANHPPGSSDGTSLASEVLRRFRLLPMDHTWTESLYATLQFPHRSQRSSLWLLDSAGLILEQIPLNPSDYCPYSATGSTTGGVVYANYGRPEDFNWLKSTGVSVVGCVVVMRVGGGVSFAEKVWLAERSGAGGALIYPDPADLPQDPRRLGLNTHTAVSEHVHLGSGDPFTPGFPSFNHTQFPPIQSSGLPLIPALPISATVAAKLLSQLSGPSCPPSWRGRLPYVRCVVGPEFSSGRRVKMLVHNVMTPVLLNNIFSSLEGRVDPDQYIILGAQRDSLGPGAVKSGVGTAILLELARTFAAMVKNGFSPRRSLLFVSWDAGDFGNVGATEWLEGYLSMLHLKAVAYFSLDQAVMGDDALSAYTSPLLVDLLDAAIRQVEHPKHAGQTIYSQAEREGGSWRIMKPLYLNSGAYSFTAFAGVPAVELRFTEERAYPFVNTPLDSVSRLQEVLGGRLGVTGRSLGELVGEMVLRLAHDHILPLRITSYAQTVLQFSALLNKHSAELQVRHALSPHLDHWGRAQSRGLSPQWVFSARGDYSRAAETLQRAIDYSDLHDPTAARCYNTRIMRVEYYFLSQYVSVVETPFRHVIHGRGDHTLSALTEHLTLLTSDPERFDEKRFRRQLAFFTWTLQGAANALNGDVWSIHNTHAYTH
ncbi:transferrin receptor protein 2 isoform X1 [Sebastes umbrosus]|uniref:transferrin receptor protein 2 isoform X1 n=2 Tax=Sebastes umbrosus TaxID=72105 RepID=UPI00189CCDA3|nr:transferrin receptor protein 2 isoform X1 [Sebastes umbrosus]XP_037618874.1 transferrin receptor protein 2 isoform X1 [Sebastes umbrosus]XP_037618875.1 transferrin receptor protein 2 isoform X1 [Sebastes umbrosus]XP_037618877.1 transferrin receptor protein 2 isoform X1 [Sebastes umbrosus]